ncbi:acetate/propionate family kinase [Acidiferrobacter sp.]|uniref:acetate/propionate family kinase n=1 Tax=Acidiferrobacter sp. TaxID=1872107 RepID=UPI00262EEBC2|nr:acetate/propionate family kinase [Acidiferrobacter sp.]
MAASPLILCINSGSSSLKFALYRIDAAQEALVARGAIEGLGGPEGHGWLEEGGQPVPMALNAVLDHHAAIGTLFTVFAQRNRGTPQAVGHRLVSGGPNHVRHARIDPAFLRDVRQAVEFAPLHLPAAIDAIEAVGQHYPDLPQVACMDTAFHAALPEIAARLPLPRLLWDSGVRKYGFHGLSYEYILTVLSPSIRQGRVIIAHLGNGASMAAVVGGRPVDTTMGLTPAGGFMMGTRSGDVDPGVLIYLLAEKGYSPETLEDLVNHQSGLYGVSGGTADMEQLLKNRATDPRAAQAIDMFCYQAAKAMGALAVAMNGVDTLVFTGGIGEHAAPVRASIVEALGHLGARLDVAANTHNASTISAPGSRITLLVIPTHEDLMIARHTHRLLM